MRTDDIAGPEEENGAGAHLTLARFPSLFSFSFSFCFSVVKVDVDGSTGYIGKAPNHHKTTGRRKEKKKKSESPRILCER